MITILPIAQIVISILLITAILLQQKGGGLSPVFGGESGQYHTRRGVEKTLFIGTIVLAVLFIVVAFLTVFLR